jgi:hypothetical protein
MTGPTTTCEGDDARGKLDDWQRAVVDQPCRTELRAVLQRDRDQT